MALYGLHNLAVMMPAWAVATLLNLLLGLHHCLLLGLRAYAVPGAEPVGVAAGAKKVKASKAPGNTKRDKEIDLGSAENLLVFNLDPVRLTDTPFLGLLEYAVRASVRPTL